MASTTENSIVLGDEWQAWLEQKIANQNTTTNDSTDPYYVYDHADVLSSDTEEMLSLRNRALSEELGVVVAVVTCDYGYSDLDRYVLAFGDSVGLSEYDMIVVLDISGDNYWLIQGVALVDLFTDTDCTIYVWSYMENYFSQGDYEGAVLSLTKALEEWYYKNSLPVNTTSQSHM